MFVDGPNLSDRNPSPAPRLVQAVLALARHLLRSQNGHLRRPQKRTPPPPPQPKRPPPPTPKEEPPPYKPPPSATGASHTPGKGVPPVRAKESTPVPDLRPVVLWRLWGGELDEARTLQCLPGFSRRQPERLSGGHALDLWSLWGGKFNPEECMQLPLL